MALPFVGVGLLYRNGYFRQTIDADGHQEHAYPDYDLTRLPLPRVLGRATASRSRSRVELPGRDLHGRGLARPGRPGAGAAARHRHPRERRRPTGRSRTSSTSAAARCGSTRSSSWASAACGRCGRSGIEPGGLAPQRGPLGVPARGAGARAGRDRRDARRGLATRSGATACSRSTRPSRPATSASTPTSSGASRARCSTATAGRTPAACPIERVLELGRGVDGDADASST